MSVKGGIAAIPAPVGRRFFGSLADYEEDPIGYLERCRDELGDVFALTSRHVVVCRPDLARQVFARTGREFRFQTARATRRVSLMSDHVDRWMLARRSQPSRAMVVAAADQVRERLRAWFTEISTAETCQQAATGALLPLLVADVDPQLRHLVIGAGRAASPHLRSLGGWRGHRLRGANDALIEALARRVASRTAGASKHRDQGFDDGLELLKRAGGLSDVEIAQVLAAHMVNVYAVGGAALSWLFVAAAAHPETVRPGWAEAVVKETLRCYPPILTTGRLVAQDVELGEYLVRPPAAVLLSPRLMHTDPRWWHDDPARFLPQRWLDPRQAPHLPHAYVPYGSGPRVCSGAWMAQTLLTETFELLATEWNVTIDPPNPAPLPGAFVLPNLSRITLTPK